MAHDSFLLKTEGTTHKKGPFSQAVGSPTQLPRFSQLSFGIINTQIIRPLSINKTNLLNLLKQIFIPNQP